jgi:hypothetical protein
MPIMRAVYRYPTLETGIGCNQGNCRMSAAMRYRRLRRGYPPWLSCGAVFLLALVAAAACGCASVSYKPGGSEHDYQAARDRCHKEGRAESPDFERCMQEQGWVVKQLGAPAAPSDAKKSAPAASPSPGSPPSPTAGAVAPSSQRSDAPSAEHPIVVKNWFKLGGTAAELAAAKQRCATKLGVADRPEPESQVVTGEMLDCLRNEGWRAF